MECLTAANVNTLKRGDKLRVENVSSRAKSYAIGDIVTFLYDNYASYRCIKIRTESGKVLNLYYNRFSRVGVDWWDIWEVQE